jgi:hypothetical protein
MYECESGAVAVIAICCSELLSVRTAIRDMSMNRCLSIERAARCGHFANRHVSLIEGAHGTLFKNCINSVTAGPSFEKRYERLCKRRREILKLYESAREEEEKLYESAREEERNSRYESAREEERNCMRVQEKKRKKIHVDCNRPTTTRGIEPRFHQRHWRVMNHYTTWSL